MFSRWDVLLGSQSEVLARRIKSCVSIFYGFVNLRVVFNNTYKDRFSRSQRSKVVYRANCWDCDSFYVIVVTFHYYHFGIVAHFAG